MIQAIKIYDVTVDPALLVQEYFSVYDFEYPERASSSEVSYLSQEGVTVSFTLPLDDFLDGMIIDGATANYRFDCIEDDESIIIRGYIGDIEEAVSIDREQEMITIQVTDIISFVNNAEEVWALSNSSGQYYNFKEAGNTISNNTIVLYTLLSGCKNLLRHVSTEVVKIKKWRSFYLEEMLGRAVENQILYLSCRDYNGIPEPDLKCWVATDNEDIYNKYKQYKGYATTTFNDTWYSLPRDEDVLEWVHLLDNINIFYLFALKTDQDTESETYTLYSYNTSLKGGLLGYVLNFNYDYLPFDIGNIDAHKFYFRHYLWNSDYSDFSGSHVCDIIQWMRTEQAAYDKDRDNGYNPNCNVLVHNYGTTSSQNSWSWNAIYITWVTKNWGQDHQPFIYWRWGVYTDPYDGDYIRIRIYYGAKNWGFWQFGRGKVDPVSEGAKKTGYWLQRRDITLRGASLLLDDKANKTIHFSNWLENEDGVDPENFDIAILSQWINNTSNPFNCLKEIGSTFWTDEIQTFLKANHSQCRFYARAKDFADKWVPDREVFTCKLNGQPFTYTLTFDNYGPEDERGEYDVKIKCLGPINLTAQNYKDDLNLKDSLRYVLMSNNLSLTIDEDAKKINLSNKSQSAAGTTLSSDDIIEPEETNLVPEYPDLDVFSVISKDEKSIEQLNSMINTGYNRIFSECNKKISFEYSSIDSGIKPKLFDSFEWNGEDFSVVSVKKIEENIYKIEATKNGNSTLYFDSGTGPEVAYMSNDGITNEKWNIRSV